MAQSSQNVGHPGFTDTRVPNLDYKWNKGIIGFVCLFIFSKNTGTEKASKVTFRICF